MLPISSSTGNDGKALDTTPSSPWLWWMRPRTTWGCDAGRLRAVPKNFVLESSKQTSGKWSEMDWLTCFKAHFVFKTLNYKHKTVTTRVLFQGNATVTFKTCAAGRNLSERLRSFGWFHCSKASWVMDPSGFPLSARKSLAGDDRDDVSDIFWREDPLEQAMNSIGWFNMV